MAKKRRTKKLGNKNAFSKAVKKSKKLRTLKQPKKKIKTDPTWDLERDGVTFSLMNQFLNCRHRTHMRYVQGWTSKHVNLPLEFGNIIHMMDEAHDRGFPINHIPVNYVKSRNNATEKAIRDLAFLAASCYPIYQGYINFWNENPSIRYKKKDIYAKNIKWIGKEKIFDVTHRMPSGMKIKLTGRRDGLFQFSPENRNRVFETKTKQKVDEYGIEKALNDDMQSLFYCYATQLECNGVIPAGFLYNLIRRPSLKPRVNDTPTDYAARIEEDIAKRPSWYYMRWSVDITEETISTFIARQLNPVLFQIVTWWNSIKKNKDLDPWSTIVPCSYCESINGGTEEYNNCSNCGGSREVSIPNPHHWCRPINLYDSGNGVQPSQTDFFDPITHNSYLNYYQRDVAFIELTDNEDVTQYVVDPKSR